MSIVKQHSEKTKEIEECTIDSEGKEGTGNKINIYTNNESKILPANNSKTSMKWKQTK